MRMFRVTVDVTEEYIFNIDAIDECSAKKAALVEYDWQKGFDRLSFENRTGPEVVNIEEVL